MEVRRMAFGMDHFSCLEPRRRGANAGRSLLGHVLLGLWVAGLALSAWPVAAQTDCSLQLAEARDEYDVGRFERVVELLEPCKSEGQSYAVRADTRVWRAKAFLAMDEMELAAAEVQLLIQLRPSYEPSTAESLAFQNLVRQAKAGGGPQVTSVSKKAESLREAPATVSVITGEQIKNRGYNDLVAYLSDLPGFDMATTGGIMYSLIYPRGYRADNTNRLLILVDGVEDNGLWTSNAWISRQYPLSNIEAVEVVYGPASTMYGANAFLGVINIITKSPRAFLEEDKNWAIETDLTYGSWNTRALEFTIAGKSDTLGFSYSLTGRKFLSEEFDPSAYEDWDYALEDVDFYRSKLTLTGDEAVDAFLDAHCGQGCDPYDNPDFMLVDGTTRQIVPTDSSANRARDYDAQALATGTRNRPVSWSGDSDDWYINAKLQSGYLTLGLQSWRREEMGGTWFNDWRFGGTDEGTLWVPRQLNFYANYERPLLGNRLFLSSFTRYKRHGFDDPSALTEVRSYWNGRGRNLSTLLSDTPATWFSTYYFTLSSQLREEIKAVWIPSANFDLVSGFEFRFGDIQGDFIQSRVPNPQETGFAGSTTEDGQTIPGKNSFNVRDLGLYVQASYKPWKQWKFILGGRLDDNKIGNTGGYGTVFNLRAGVVYSPSDFTVKAIYGEAFKDASNREKFSSVPGFRIPNPTLEPEQVENLDVSVAWDPNEDLHVDLTGYSSDFSQVLQAVPVVVDGQTVTQNQAIGRQEARGLQANAWYRFDFYGDHKVYINYTFAEPENKDTGKRIGDIAEHQVNFGLDMSFTEAWDASLRGNWVGDRQTGAGTTVATNPLSQVDSYLVFNAAVSYELPIDGLEAQLVINNLLDEEYWHNGIRSARAQYPNRHIQPDRSYFAKVRYHF